MYSRLLMRVSALCFLMSLVLADAVEEAANHRYIRAERAAPANEIHNIYPRQDPTVFTTARTANTEFAPPGSVTPPDPSATGTQTTTHAANTEIIPSANTGSAPPLVTTDSRSANTEAVGPSIAINMSTPWDPETLLELPDDWSTCFGMKTNRRRCTRYISWRNSANLASAIQRLAAVHPTQVDRDELTDLLQLIANAAFCSHDHASQRSAAVKDWRNQIYTAYPPAGGAVVGLAPPTQNNVQPRRTQPRSRDQNQGRTRPVPLIPKGKRAQEPDDSSVRNSDVSPAHTAKRVRHEDPGARRSVLSIGNLEQQKATQPSGHPSAEQGSARAEVYGHRRADPALDLRGPRLAQPRHPEDLVTALPAPSAQQEPAHRPRKLYSSRLARRPDPVVDARESRLGQSGSHADGTAVQPLPLVQQVPSRMNRYHDGSRPDRRADPALNRRDSQLAHSGQHEDNMAAQPVSLALRPSQPPRLTFNPLPGFVVDVRDIAEYPRECDLGGVEHYFDDIVHEVFPRRRGSAAQRREHPQEAVDEDERIIAPSDGPEDRMPGSWPGLQGRPARGAGHVAGDAILRALVLDNIPQRVQPQPEALQEQPIEPTPERLHLQRDLTDTYYVVQPGRDHIANADYNPLDPSHRPFGDSLLQRINHYLRTHDPNPFTTEEVAYFREVRDAEDDRRRLHAEQAAAQRLPRQVERRPIEGECPMCLEDMDVKDVANIEWCKTGCGNNIHRECLEKWKASKKTCIICRKEL
ncbi:hypothetical protein BDV96DRAFT_666744 [Lophiotrema nucula]|uniref:RING-type domain-containing protein n=1 Tax=Lophiotrema nucula TaxID=690887 RepID=A0A6A5YW03_9PLEO|nr:hypothetical protein BDV96DRAFT_666744 [Lophiotrema nucula]